MYSKFKFPWSLTENDNLAQQKKLTEQSMLASLKERMMSGKIYTNVGEIVIATNPYFRLQLYTDQISKKYAHKEEGLPPHVFYLAGEGYERMLRVKKNQAFVISGESGAGKTETTKFIVRQLIELCKAGKSDLEQKIIRVNPMLEAFGNAQTVMNDNSSRFGKYLELKFDMTGAVLGGHLRQYLLEKSRVVTRNKAERNYHIFYYLFTGKSVDAWKPRLEALGLKKSAGDHKYLKGDTVSDAWVSSAANVSEFTEMTETFELVGFTSSDIQSMFNLLAGMLLIGDVEFKDGGNDNAEISDGDGGLTKAAQHFGCDPRILKETLLKDHITIGKEKVEKSMTHTKAADNRDSIVKGIYGRVFIWIFNCVNAMLIDETSANEKGTSLGILDIFGFEDFEYNSIEQMCINITNEMLQFYFNNFIFAKEGEEYAAEGIDIGEIKYEDNEPTLNMFLAKGGLLDSIDDENKQPKATDVSLTNRINSEHKDKSFFKAPKMSDALNFEVVHYAGTVNYQTHNWLEKNRDAISNDASQMCKSSSDDLLKKLYADDFIKTGNSKKKPTLSSIFKKNLTDLKETLNESDPHFVRCIKPNMQKKAEIWDDKLVERQLRYAGVMETVRIRRLGYSYRETFADFVRRFKIIAFPFGFEPEPTLATCKTICSTAGDKIGKMGADWQVGKTKVFMKYFHEEALLELNKIQWDAVAYLQKVLKAYHVRQQYKELLKSSANQKEYVANLSSRFKKFAAEFGSKVTAGAAEDEKEKGNRIFLKSVKEQEAAAEVARKESEKGLEGTRSQIEKEMMAELGIKDKKNPQLKKALKRRLTYAVGKLPDNWEKKIDKRTGRVYFKNHAKKETSWIDPRSEQVKKKVGDKDYLDADPDDELPYGWDEAKTPKGRTYYIDHLTHQTHWVHPQKYMQAKLLEFQEAAKQAEEKQLKRRGTVVGFRDKKKRLQNQRAKIVDDKELKELDERISAMDEIIKKQLDQQKKEGDEADKLKKEVQDLQTRFKQKEFENENGEGSFFADDTDDLYSTEKKEEVDMSAIKKTSAIDQEALKEILQTQAPSGYSKTMERRGQKFSVKRPAGKSKKGKK